MIENIVRQMERGIAPLPVGTTSDLDFRGE